MEVYLHILWILTNKYAHFFYFFGFFLYIQNSWIVTHEHKSRSPSNLDHFWGKFCPLLKTINIQGFIWVEEKWSHLNIFLDIKQKPALLDCDIWDQRTPKIKENKYGCILNMWILTPSLVWHFYIIQCLFKYCLNDFHEENNQI